MPFLVITVEGAFCGADRGFEEAAATLGASRLTAFRRVTLPLIAPVARGRRGALLGPGARRVRRDDHLRRQLPRPDPDHAARGLPGAGDRPRGRDRAVPGAARSCRSLVLASLRDRWLAAREQRRDCAATHGVPDGRVDTGRRSRCELDAQRRARRGRRRARARTAPARRPCCAPWPASSRSPPGRSGSATWCSTTSSSDTFVPPERPPVGLVFQDYRLFPHLSVLDNVAFAPRVQRSASRRRPGTAAEHWLERLGLAELADRRPASSSGGQAQRVALARALAGEPRRRCCWTSRWPRWTPGPGSTCGPPCAGTWPSSPGRCCVVTHDPLEAMVLADRLVVVEDGRVVQEGTPADVARRPATDYVARLVGLNLYAGSLDPTTGTVTLDGRREPGDDGRGRPDPAGGDPGCSSPSGRRPWPCTPPARTTSAPATSGRGRWSAWSSLADRVRVQVRGGPDGPRRRHAGRRGRARPGARIAGLAVRQGDRDGGVFPRRRRGVSPTRRRVRGSGHLAPQDPLDCQSAASTARRTPADRPDCQSSGQGRAGIGADRTGGLRQTRRFPSRCRRRTAPG